MDLLFFLYVSHHRQKSNKVLTALGKENTHVLTFINANKIVAPGGKHHLKAFMNHYQHVISRL